MLESLNRGRSRIFFRRGCTRPLLYFNTNKPHSFFCRIPVVLENRRSPRGGGVRTPCTFPLDPPLLKVILTLSPWTKSYDVTIQMKPLCLYFQMVLQSDLVFRTRLIRSPRYFEGRSNGLGFTLPLYASPVISKPRYFELFFISLGTSK